MPDPQDYILSFDLQEVETQLEDLKRLYTEVGSGLKDSSHTLVVEMKDLEESISNISSHLATITSSIDLLSTSLRSHAFDTSTFFEDMSKESKKVFENLEKVAGLDLSKAKMGAGGVPQDPRERLSDIFPDYAVKTEGITKKRLDLIIAGILDKSPEMNDLKKFRAEFKREVKSYGGKVTEEAGVIGSAMKKEFKNAGGKLKGLLAGISKGAIGAGVAGGLLSLIILGEVEKDRVDKEAGEVLNTFEGSFSGLGDKSTKKAIEWVSDFQEKAQFKYGIGRKEIQSYYKAFVDAGHESTVFFDRVGKDLGEVGHDVATVTLGIDKMLKLGSGESSKNVRTIVEQYGDSLDEAAEKYVNLSLAAKASGVGTEKFIQSVMAGSSTLAQYGVDIDNVGSAFQKLTQHYKDLGLDRQYAGTLAGQAVGGLTGAVAGMSDPMTAVIAKRVMEKRGVATGSAIENRQWFKEGFSRVAAGEESGFFEDALREMAGFIKENVSGGRAQQIKAAESMTNSNNLTATAMMDAVDELEETGKISKATEDQLAELKKAFSREGDQVSELYKTQRDLINGMASIGRGVLKILSSILGVLITGIRSLPDLVHAAGYYVSVKPGSDDKGDEIIDNIKKAFQAQADHAQAGWNEILEGKDKLMGTPAKKVAEMFQPIADAWNFKTHSDDFEKAVAEIAEQVVENKLAKEFAEGGSGGLALVVEAIDLQVQEMGRVLSDLVGGGPGAMYEGYEKRRKSEAEIANVLDGGFSDFGPDDGGEGSSMDVTITLPADHIEASHAASERQKSK